MVNKLLIIRPKNLLIICFTLYLIKYSLINQFLQAPALNNFNFFLFVFATILITASGNIINDINDMKTDEINNKHNILNSKGGNVKVAKKWFFYLNFLALLIASYLAFKIGYPILLLIFILTAVLLWWYAKTLKKSFLIGNLLVSALIALSIINLILFDILPVIYINASSLIIIKIIMAYSLFAFLVNLKREIIKDIIDIEGDKSINANTIPLKIGVVKTNIIIKALSILTIILISFWQYFQYSIFKTSFDLSNFGEKVNQISIWGTDVISFFYVFLLQIVLFIFLYHCINATSKNDFIFLSRLSKIIMILGITSISIFTLIYFQ